MVTDEIRKLLRLLIEDLTDGEGTVRKEAAVAHLAQEGTDAVGVFDHLDRTAQAIGTIRRVILPRKRFLDVDDAGIANCSTSALFMSGLVPGILLGLSQMAVVKMYSKKKNFPKMDPVPAKDVAKLVLDSLPALLSPVILIGGIVTGFFTPTEASAVCCVYALLIGLFFYRSLKFNMLPKILIETMKLSSLSLFALATANALGELLSYYQLNMIVQSFFVSIPGGRTVFLIVVVLFFLFIGTFMDAVPAMILFCPIILPSAAALGISPIILGLIIIVTLALGLVTPPYGLCLLIASSIAKISIEDAFKGTLPYFLSSLAVLAVMILFPDLWLQIPAFLFPALFA